MVGGTAMLAFYVVLTQTMELSKTNDLYKSVPYPFST